jgi:hypothetical protein
VFAALAVVTALTAAPVAAAASTSPATAAALTQAFEAGRHIPASAVGGIRPGTLHAGTAGGTEWAIASFTPSASASKPVAAGFQDGGGTGVFSIRGGGWRLVNTGTYGCGEGLPATLKKAWGLADPAGCTASIVTQRAAAKRALSAFPAPARGAGLDQAIARIALSQVATSDTPVSTSFATDCDPYDAARVLPRRGRVARADLPRRLRLGDAGPARPARR